MELVLVDLDLLRFNRLLDTRWRLCRRSLLQIGLRCDLFKVRLNFLSLQVGDLVGEGAFGRVHVGRVTRTDGQSDPLVVAVKMLKGRNRHRIICLVCGWNEFRNC